jgi:homoserine kinase
MSEWVTAFAPASIGNVAVGFDMLGLAIVNVGDTVVARRVDGAGVSISEVRGIDGEIHPQLSSDSAENTASVAASALWHSQHAEGGVELKVHKGVPLQSGMGSSAASAVAGVMAVNALLDKPLSIPELLMPAIEGEKLASGGLHADNVAPSLLGGLILCPEALLPDAVSINVPNDVSSVLLHPELQVNTAESRNGLMRGVGVQQWLEQQGYLAGFVTACEQNNHDLLAKCLRDVIVEPQRAASVPCLPVVQKAAMKQGAFGCSLSGSGPSMFALCADADAQKIAAAMEQACRDYGYECQSWVSTLDAPGATVRIGT